MSSEQIKILKLGELAKIKGGKRMPAGTALTSEKSNHPYLRIVDFKDGSIDRSNLQYVPDEVFPAISRYIISSRDLYVSIVGTIGLVGKVPEDLSGANLTENAAKICDLDESRIDKNYLGYYLRSEAGQGEIKALAVGSTQPKLALFRIEQINVPCPPLSAQRRIASLLGALDDRITLLRETRTTLEAIAQALFKSWFVDFDPVRAKAEGRQPEGMDAATAALFPDSFEESELGLVPRGWKTSSIGQSFILTMGQSPPGDTYNEDGEGIPFYQGRTDFGFRFPTQRIFCTAPTRIAEVGDTLVSVRAPVGDVNVALEPCALGRGVASIRHHDGKRSFTFYSIRQLKAHFELYDGEGTVFGSINKKDFESLPVVIPDSVVLQAFEDIASPLDDSIEMNEQKLRTLTHLRDTLLPRLISGQLRLPEAEAAVEEVL